MHSEQVTDDGTAPFLTLLTPSWNRAHLLPRLHRSIIANLPTNRQIEWLLLDDGSTDNTHERAASFQADPNLSVKYCRIDHGGKHRALNVGFEQASGQWILIIDSDDWFLNGAINLALQEIEKADQQGAEGLFLPMKVAGREQQFNFERPDRCVALMDRINQEKQFDCTFVFSRHICRSRFPEIPGENFLPESAFLLDLEPSFKFYLSDEICVGVEYQPDGLSLNSLRIRSSSPVGITLTYSRMLAQPLRPMLRLRALVNYGRFWWHCIWQSARPVAPASPSQVAILPFSLVFSLRDLWRRWRLG